MALRTFYFIRTLTKALTYYYINHSQRYLLFAIENNQFGGPIGSVQFLFKDSRVKMCFADYSIPLVTSGLNLDGRQSQKLKRGLV